MSNLYRDYSSNDYHLCSLSLRIFLQNYENIVTGHAHYKITKLKKIIICVPYIIVCMSKLGTSVLLFLPTNTEL